MMNRTHANAWRDALIIGSVGTLLLLLAYWPTALSIEAIWRRSGNFTHGYAILPIAAYMLWTLKDGFANYTPKPAWFVLVIPVAAAGLWGAAKLVDVLVIEQLALVLMIQGLWIALLGWRVAWFIVVPLFYLFFAVPFGQGLEPWLQDYTAWFSVQALKLSGIPVFWEGLFITIPSGAFEVAEACSGMRYLVASVALGVLYAFLNFYTWRYRLFFVLLSVVVPIVANGLRAYLIIMLAHLSDHKLAVGVDHLVYGWLFFGLVMYLLFLLGNRLRDREGDLPAPQVKALLMPAVSFGVLVVVGIAAIAGALLVKPAYSTVVAAKSALITPVVQLPEALSRWQRFGSGSDNWQPSFRGASVSRLGSYQRAGGTVDFALYYYRGQQQGAELGGDGNVSHDSDRWRRVGMSSQRVTLGDQQVLMVEERLRNGFGRERLVWRVYWVSGRYTNSDTVVKIAEAAALLKGEYKGSAAMLFSTLSHSENMDYSRDILREFAEQAIPAFAAELYGVEQ